MENNEIPTVVQSEKFQFLTSVWIVPMIALIVALWLAWQYFSTLGPKVDIIFKSSSGLKIGESQVKMRDVPIGVVKDIKLLDQQNGVLVTVRLNKDSQKYLNKDTKFWIARPQINTKGISGLDTLMSGPYIAMYGKVGKGRVRKYIGLEQPYIDKTATPGRKFKLSAPDSRDLSAGANVYFRKIKVGTLESVKLTNDGQRVDFTIFIKEPYAKLVTTQTQFYRTNNLSFDFSASTFKVDVAPLSNLLSGGIAFSTTNKSVRDHKLNSDFVFMLYDNYAQARQKVIGFGGDAFETFQFEFSEPIGKLEIGAPIEFYGFEIGHVVNIESDFDSNKSVIRSIVIGMIDVSVFIDLKKGVDAHKNLQQAVQKGLKARLAQSNPITQTQYIELAFDKKDKPGKIIPTRKYAIFPTMHSNFDGLMDKVSLFVDKLNTLKIDELVNSINNILNENSPKVKQLLSNLNQAVKNINKITKTTQIQNLPKSINTTLNEFSHTLKEVNLLLEADGTKSVLSSEINTMLRELTKMSRSVQRLTDKLNQKPNALIFGDE